MKAAVSAQTLLAAEAAVLVILGVPPAQGLPPGQGRRPRGLGTGEPLPQQDVTGCRAGVLAYGPLTHVGH